jgi:hypothetical protein
LNLLYFHGSNALIPDARDYRWPYLIYEFRSFGISGIRRACLFQMEFPSNIRTLST